MDPQVREPTAWLFAAMAETAPPPVGDVASRRVAIEALQTRSFNSQPMPTGVAVEDFLTRSHDGTELLLRWYHSDEAIHGSAPGSAVCYLHGGGMILSSVSIYDGPVARYVESSGVPFLSVEYRLAPEHPHPTPVEDCYAGLVYLHEHAEELGVDPARIAVMGDSGGGGLAASLAILVRDRQGPPIARQILIYPMLDDRNTVPEPELLANVPRRV
jgi:acetyl esterase/lipase